MKLISQGWSRNCGNKTIAHGIINARNIGVKITPIYMGDVYVRVLGDDDTEEGVEIAFGTEVQLGGRHLVRQRISASELLAMLDACTRPPVGRTNKSPMLRVIQ